MSVHASGYMDVVIVKHDGLFGFMFVICIKLEFANCIMSTQAAALQLWQDVRALCASSSDELPDIQV